MRGLLKVTGVSKNMTNEIKEEKIVPVYQFAEGQETLEPMKRTIKKTMEVTETFTAYDVLQYIAKMDKAIMDKETELKGLQDMKTAYLSEMVEVESQTSVNELQEQYQTEVAEAVNHDNENTDIDKQEVADAEETDL